MDEEELRATEQLLLPTLGFWSACASAGQEWVIPCITEKMGISARTDGVQKTVYIYSFLHSWPKMGLEKKNKKQQWESFSFIDILLAIAEEILFEFLYPVFQN